MANNKWPLRKALPREFAGLTDRGRNVEHVRMIVGCAISAKRACPGLALPGALRQLGPMNAIIPLSSEPALRAVLAVPVILVAAGLGVRAEEGYIYAAMAISAMNAAPSIRSCEGRETKRGISPAVTNGEIA